MVIARVVTLNCLSSLFSCDFVDPVFDHGRRSTKSHEKSRNSKRFSFNVHHLIHFSVPAISSILRSNDVSAVSTSGPRQPK